MTAYARIEDILPCLRDDMNPSGEHDWVDYRNCSDEWYYGECSWCAALIRRFWWGWEFRTGEEHFDDVRIEGFEKLHRARRMPPVLHRIGGGQNWGIYADIRAVDNMIAHAEQAPRLGEFGEATVRGLIAFRDRLEEHVEAVEAP